MSATPIPRSASPVVWFIRWWVKKPRTFPKSPFPDGVEIAWESKTIFGSVRFCPLGFIPGLSPMPWPEHVDIGLPTDAIKSFTDWWDSQTDARAAVDAVWGK